MEVTRECVRLGLEQIKPWGFLGDMAEAVHSYAVKNGYQVVREIGGHGIGLEFHEDPWVSYVCPKDTGMLMVPGMVFTIEPMINMGHGEVEWLNDDWTVVTEDGSLSAHYENTILITDGEPEILTLI